MLTLTRFKRPPNLIIGTADNPYLLRWYLIPKNRFLNIYLHKFMRSDEDRALHDHPWASCSIILKNGYREHLPNNVVKIRRAGNIVFRRASQAHRVELHRIPAPRTHKSDMVDSFCYAMGIRSKPKPAWTLFITGPKVREWGFHCPSGWRHWRVFYDLPEGEPKGNEVGRGCE